MKTEDINDIDTEALNDIPTEPILPFLGGMEDDREEVISRLINYNEKFRDSIPVLHRDSVIEQSIAVLIAMIKANALLVGPAGGGKTAVVEELARRIANHLIPELEGFTIYELPLSSLLAGSGLLGQLENKICGVIDFCSDPEQKAILFIDEIHQLVCDKDSSYSKIAQQLKPALSRGGFKMIGATTLQESQRFMEDPAFNRRFTRIIVDELSREQTLDILRSLKEPLLTHYHKDVDISDDILNDIARIADNYHKPGSHRPDSAITLFDRALASIVIKSRDSSSCVLDKEHVIDTARRIASGNSTGNDFNEEDLTTALSPVRGQEHIIREIKKLLHFRQSDLFNDSRPVTIMFVGSSGVGKSHTARLLSKYLTGSSPICLNMTEFNSSSSINRIIGSAVGYAGSDSSAEFPFDILESNPYQVILLDEFEKADKSVQRLFMSVFDEGVMKNAKGKEIDFSKSVIIATTNAEHNSVAREIGFNVRNINDGKTKEQEIADLSKWFDIELLNRFSRILTFNILNENDFTEIVSDIYSNEKRRIEAEHPSYHLEDRIPDSVMDDLVHRHFSMHLGARHASQAVQEYIILQLTGHAETESMATGRKGRNENGF